MRLMMFAAAAALTASAGAAETPILPDATVLDVSATGRVTRVPDLATVRAGVTTQADTAVVALSTNAERMARVMAALRTAGIAARDVATSSVSLQPQYRYVNGQPPVVTGYQASNTVSVRFRDITRSGAGLDALVKAGANQIDGPTLAIDKPDAALDAARADAVARARARAALYAQAAGLRVDRIVSIAEAGEDAGGGPPRPVMFMAREKADAPATTMVAGETEVTATVSVRFLLKQR